MVTRSESSPNWSQKVPFGLSFEVEPPEQLQKSHHCTLWKQDVTVFCIGHRKCYLA